MRLRNVKGARERIENSTFAVNEDSESTLMERKGKWNTYFGNDNPIHIEIGMGKGKFIMELAKQNPNINYIGIEKFSSVLIRAIELREALEEETGNAFPNLFLIRMDAENLEKIFDQDEISRIYLNFSDPWPKDRHAKRRLTSDRFLERYNNILIPDGRIFFKTDNRDLFDYSLESIEASGWKLDKVTFDLHNSEYVEGNIMTEYETRFYNEGKPICRLEAYRDK